MKSSFMSFSFGCRVNEAEKQRMDQHLLDMGFVWNEKHPTFYILNTCAITGKAEREVRQHIYQTKKRFPNTKIVATGCSATLWMKNKIFLKEVDYWIENKDKNTIPTFLQTLTKQTPTNNSASVSQDKFLHSGRVMIKIQDGCDRFCSYCIVPFTRGRASSRTIADIVSDIRHILLPIQEIILTAINTEYFGKDTHETLTQLVDTILSKTTVPKISFGSIHPWSITKEFLSWYQDNKDNPRFVHFFHVPIQSGSDTILRYMKRGYTKQGIQEKLQTLHAINPNALIATDVIVGFPGETEKEFKETYAFLKNSPISKFHVFRYSPRPGTAATAFPNEPSPQEKQKRSQALRLLEKQKMKLTT